MPSAAAWARAVPAIAALRPGFLAPGAVILPGASTNPDFDIAQLQALQKVDENAFSGRLDFKLNDQLVVLRPRLPRPGHERPARRRQRPRRAHRPTTRPTRSSTCRACWATARINEFKFGYNAAPTDINGVGADRQRHRLRRASSLNLSGSVANTGIAGQGASSGIAVPGGLVRANSATNGRGQPYDPVLAVVRRLAELACAATTS